MNGLEFAEPRWLWLAIGVPLLLLALMRYAASARKRQLRTLVSAARLPELTASHSPARRFTKNALLVVGSALIGIALARPQWGIEEFSTQRLDDDLVFAIDCSRSMLATDISPNRLERAKLAVMDFVRRHPKGRIGLVAFSGQAFLQCPLTFDYDAFEESLMALDDKTLAVQGTDIGRALDEAHRAIEKKSRRKTIVLITDGEDLEQSGVRAAESLARDGVKVFTVGVGTAAGSEIRILNDQNHVETLRDAEGQPVHSRLDETTLKAIAGATQGSYFPLGGLGEGLARIHMALEDETAAPGRIPSRRLGIDRFHWFVGTVILLLVLESLMGTRRSVETTGTSHG